MRNTLLLIFATGLFSIVHSASAVEGQFGSHFQQRFGLDSPIYNAPLYFQTNRLKQTRTTKRHTSYREKIKKQVNQESKTRTKKRRS